MSTATPFEPKPGYKSRWRKQAFSLMTRSPAALVVTFIGMGLSGFFSAILASSVLALTGEAGLNSASILHTVTLTAFAALTACLTTSLFFKADNRPGVSLWTGFASWKATLYPILIVVFTFEVIWSFLLPEPANQSTFAQAAKIVLLMIGEGELPIGEIAFYSLATSNTGMAGTLVGMVWSSYLLIPLLQGLGGTWREAKAFDQQLRAKMPAVHWHLFMMLLLAVFATVTLPIVNILVFHYLMAWLYVATRELAGGISENSTETAKAPTQAVANPI